MANHRGGSGNFAEDRERASEAGKKGGGLINDECIFVCSSSKSHHRRLPGG